MIFTVIPNFGEAKVDKLLPAKQRRASRDARRASATSIPVTMTSPVTLPKSGSGKWSAHLKMAARARVMFRGARNDPDNKSRFYSRKAWKDIAKGNLKTVRNSPHPNLP